MMHFLGPYKKRVKLTKANNGIIKDVVRFAKKDQKQGDMQLIDLRGDGKDEIVITSKIKRKVRLTLVKIKKKKKVFGKKLTKKFNKKKIIPTYTEYDSTNNLIKVKNKNKKVKKQYRVTKKYNLKVVK